MPRKKQAVRKAGDDDKEGILFQRKSTQKCYFIYYTGKVDENGVRERPWIDLHTTDKVAAKETVKNIRADLAKKGRYDPPTEQSVGEWLDFWLDEVIKPKKAEDEGASTYDFYEYNIRVHIKPGVISKNIPGIKTILLGEIPLRELSPEDIQKFFNHIKAKKKLSKKKDEKGNYIPSDDPLSKRTIHGIEETLSMALIKAVAMRKIPDNPMAGIDRTKFKRTKVKYMTGDQVADFLEKVQYDPWYYVYLTTLGTGIRLSELAALQWNDVDLVNKKIRIDEGRIEVNTYAEEGPKTKIIIKGPKSEEGNRYIPLPDDVVIGLKKWKEIQIKERWDWENKRHKEEERYKAGKFVHRKYKRPEYFKSGYVFTKPDGHPPRPGHLSKHFLELVREHGYEGLTFHMQRHSYVTILLENGEENWKTIQENLGDATLQVVTDIYGHIPEALKKKAVERLNGFSSKKKKIN